MLLGVFRRAHELGVAASGEGANPLQSRFVAQQRRMPLPLHRQQFEARVAIGHRGQRLRAQDVGKRSADREHGHAAEAT